MERVMDYTGELRYTDTQTTEMCLDAVRKDWRALYLVKEQTPEICLEAVRSFGKSLLFVKEQSLLVGLFVDPLIV